jgi:uncharacterized protein (DUF885 family)
VDERVRQLADDNVADWVRLDPCGAIISGIAVPGAALTDYSDEASQDLGALARRTRDAAVGLLPDLPSGASRIAAAVIAERCGVEADLYDSGQMQRRLDVVTCPLQQVRRAIDLTPRPNEEQRALLADRLVAAPAAIRSYVAALETAADRGDVPALRQVHAVASQCERLVDTGHRRPRRGAGAPPARSGRPCF